MVSSALAKYTTKTTRPDMKLYLTLSQHAKQVQFMALTSETWPGMLAQARTNYHKQKTFDGPFVVHLLMYAAKKYAKAFVVRLESATGEWDFSTNATLGCNECLAPRGRS
ncbi:hypothetical protein PC128_g23655 [Phytophthora cactorum]|nr:hypothetical protein PC128_g23655 [Phytophthora cactorum]